MYGVPVFSSSIASGRRTDGVVTIAQWRRHEVQSPLLTVQFAVDCILLISPCLKLPSWSSFDGERFSNPGVPQAKRCPASPDSFTSFAFMWSRWCHDLIEWSLCFPCHATFSLQFQLLCLLCLSVVTNLLGSQRSLVPRQRHFYLKSCLCFYSGRAWPYCVVLWRTSGLFPLHQLSLPLLSARYNALSSRGPWKSITIYLAVIF